MEGAPSAAMPDAVAASIGGQEETAGGATHPQPATLPSASQEPVVQPGALAVSSSVSHSAVSPGGGADEQERAASPAAIPVPDAGPLSREACRRNDPGPHPLTKLSSLRLLPLPRHRQAATGRLTPAQNNYHRDGSSRAHRLRPRARKTHSGLYESRELLVPLQRGQREFPWLCRRLRPWERTGARSGCSARAGTVPQESTRGDAAATDAREVFAELDRVPTSARRPGPWRRAASRGGISGPGAGLGWRAGGDVGQRVHTALVPGSNEAAGELGTHMEGLHTYPAAQRAPVSRW